MKMKETNVFNAPVADEVREKMPLLRNNYVIMVIAALLIVTGFVLMAGQGSDTSAYNPDIFSSRRIVVGPLLSFAGYVVMAVAIIVKPKDSVK